jgi:hypothetical protein
MIWHQWAEDWELYHKVTFDGPSRSIIINDNETDISVQADIYSAWKRWVKIRDHSRYLSAIRVIGGDPTVGNLLAGDIYFLINNWQVIVKNRVNVSGVLYHDDGIDPYVVEPGGGVISTVSNLVQTVVVSGSGSGSNYPTVQEIREEIDMNSTALQEIKEAQKDQLTVNKYLALQK